MFESQTENGTEVASPVDDISASKGTFRTAPLNKRVFEAFLTNEDSPGSSPNQRNSGVFGQKGGIAKSSSFNKFKDAFETGKVYVNDDEEYTSSDNDVVRNTSTTEARMEIEAELDELRSCPRLKRMFNINKPANRPSPLAKSSSSSAVSETLGLDEKTRNDVSQARSQIRNMFESSAPKITFGQKLSEQVSSESPKQTKSILKKTSSSQGEERAWVFDAINKFFDVIVEDEKEVDEDEEDDDEMEDESDISEDEEISPVFASEVKCTSSRFTYDVEKPYQEEPQYDLFRAEPINIRELDEGEEEEEDLDSCDEEASDDEEYLENENTEQNLPIGGFQLQKSASSNKIRGHFHSLLMRSASGKIDGNANLSNFKSNLRVHLQRRGSLTLSTGGGELPSKDDRCYQVDDPSDDDEFSSDDDLQFEDAEDAIVEETGQYYKVPL